MKKILFTLAFMALLLTGCQKEKFEGSSDNGETIEVSFTAMLEKAEATRAVADKDGNAKKVNHWVLEVRDKQNDLFLREERDVKAGKLEQTYKLKLFKNQEYTLQFWADTKGAYVTSDLTAISTVGSVANKDSRDAFSANVSYTSLVSESQSVELKRPFGQLNIITTDLKELKKAMVYDTYKKYAPAALKVVATIPTTFNVQTQKAGDAVETTLTAEASYADFLAGKPETTLFMDYIFASADQKDIVNFAFSFTTDNVPVNHNFTSIPMQRNYRTNIKGQMMSNDSEWTVTIDPEWDGEYSPEFIIEGSVDAAINALKGGKTAIEITEPEDYDTPVAMPVETNGKDISINVTGVSDKAMKFCLAEGAQGPANLYITTDAQDIEIDCPNSHVEVNGGTYQSVTATTSATTLVVGKDVTINTLTIKGGNAEIHGLVKTIKKQASTVVDFYVGTAAGLLQFHDLYAAGMVATTAKVYIENDIDFTGNTWTACEWHADKATKGFALFDGQNHTIKNFTVSGQGMFSRWAGGATPYFKDIVFDGAKNVTSNLNVSLFCGQVYQNAKIENVTIKNSQFEGTYKVAPFVGTVYDEKADRTATLTLKDCKVENTTVRGTSYDFDICGMVAFVYEENNDKIAFEGNNVVKDVTLYYPTEIYNMCAKIYHNGDTAYDEADNVTVTNVNIVKAQ